MVSASMANRSVTASRVEERMWPAMTWRAKAPPIHVAAARTCKVNSSWSTRICRMVGAGDSLGSVRTNLDAT